MTSLKPACLLLGPFSTLPLQWALLNPKVFWQASPHGTTPSWKPGLHMNPPGHILPTLIPTQGVFSGLLNPGLPEFPEGWRMLPKDRTNAVLPRKSPVDELLLRAWLDFLWSQQWSCSKSLLSVRACVNRGFFFFLKYRLTFLSKLKGERRQSKHRKIVRRLRKSFSTDQALLYSFYFDHHEILLRKLSPLAAQ